MRKDDNENFNIDLEEKSKKKKIELFIVAIKKIITDNMPKKYRYLKVPIEKTLNEISSFLNTHIAEYHQEEMVKYLLKTLFYHLGTINKKLNPPLQQALIYMQKNLPPSFSDFNRDRLFSQSLSFSKTKNPKENSSYTSSQVSFFKENTNPLTVIALYLKKIKQFLLTKLFRYTPVTDMQSMISNPGIGTIVNLSLDEKNDVNAFLKKRCLNVYKHGKVQFHDIMESPFDDNNRENIFGKFIIHYMKLKRQSVAKESNSPSLEFLLSLMLPKLTEIRGLLANQQELHFFKSKDIDLCAIALAFIQQYGIQNKENITEKNLTEHLSLLSKFEPSVIITKETFYKTDEDTKPISEMPTNKSFPLNSILIQTQTTKNDEATIFDAVKEQLSQTLMPQTKESIATFCSQPLNALTN